jgi:hypothetical protein
MGNMCGSRLFALLFDPLAAAASLVKRDAIEP